MSKICNHCKTEKEDNEFYSRGGKLKHLLDSNCKTCRKSVEFRVKANIRNQRYEKTTRADLYKRDPRFYLWYIAKKRASSKNLEFTIIPDDIIFTGFCPITGMEIDISTNKLNSSMSLDRVDNSKGYIPGNVVAISRWANLRKSDLTVEHLENMIKYIKEYSK